ncbi:MAG: response regulator [Caulobacteraceae bacterium]|nr:response regulator [Caulobacteraceae bacterium]
MSLLAEPTEAPLGQIEREDTPVGRPFPAPVAGGGARATDAPGCPGSADPAVEAGAVLIVEDDAIVAFQIETSLEDEGFTVCGVAATAKAGLSMFEERRPEFAVLDVRLAEGDGRDVARWIAQLSPRTTILMCTSEDEDNLQGIGAHALLRKPFDFESVGAALMATRDWSRGECAVNAPPHLVRLRPRP